MAARLGHANAASTQTIYAHRMQGANDLAATAIGRLSSAGGGGRRAILDSVGLYWPVAPAWQRQGIATEAARLLVEHAFAWWHLGRIVARRATRTWRRGG
jgi:hypothetical protein